LHVLLLARPAESAECGSGPSLGRCSSLHRWRTAPMRPECDRIRGALGGRRGAVREGREVAGEGEGP